jgi:hypothetical protein
VEVSLGLAGSLLWLFGTMRASKRIHQLLVQSIFGSTFRYVVTLLAILKLIVHRWLDTVPAARVITRCTQVNENNWFFTHYSQRSSQQDLQSVDGGIRQLYSMQTVTIASITLRLLSIMYVVGWSALVAGLVVLMCGVTLGRIYVSGQRCKFAIVIYLHLLNIVIVFLAVKREQNVAKAPILSLFGAGLAGLREFYSMMIYGYHSWARNSFHPSIQGARTL